MLRVAIALAAAVTTIPAYAQIFKCTDSAGGVEYRDGRCPPETSATVIDIPVQTTLGSRPNADVGSVRTNEDRPARTQKRPDMVAIYSFPGPRSIPPAQPVAALPPPPTK